MTFEAGLSTSIIITLLLCLQSRRWKRSLNETYTGSWLVAEPPVGKPNAFVGDKFLWAPKSHHLSAISTKLPKALDPNDKSTFIIQYEFRAANMPWECGGGYLKFFSHPAFDPLRFSGRDQYNLMFGPDRCGNDVLKIHFIIARPDPKTGKIVEHHLVNAPEPKTNEITHLYQLVLDTEAQRFDIYLDFENVRNGSMYTEFDPPLQPPKGLFVCFVCQISN